MRASRSAAGTGKRRRKAAAEPRGRRQGGAAASAQPSARPRTRSTVVGVISDTHGLVRPEALAALRGVDTIVHAGDIGGPEVLAALARVAPVVAVRGNNDRGSWARAVPTRASIEIGGARLYVLHDRNELQFDPEPAGYAAVIAGHSHRPSLERRGTVLFVNPGSAGPRRFTLPVSTARLRVAGGRVRGKLVPLHLHP